MEHVSHISSQLGADRLAQLRLAHSEAPSHRPAVQAESSTTLDQAEISELGRVLGHAHDQPGIRADKVAAARLAIQNNEEQFIAERLDATLERVIADLDDA